MEQDIEDVKERRFTEAEQVRAVYEENEESDQGKFSHFFNRVRRCYCSVKKIIGF